MPERKVIITCAVTGSIHTPSMSPHLPVTADEIAEAAIGAAEAGAAIVHLHARNPADGRPTSRPKRSSRSCARFKRSCDAVGADQRHQLVALHVDRHSLERGDAAEAEVILAPASLQQAIAVKRALQALDKKVPVAFSMHNAPGFIAKPMGGIESLEGDYEAQSGVITTNEDTEAKRFYDMLTAKYGLKAPWHGITAAGIGQTLQLVRSVEAAARKRVVLEALAEQLRPTKTFASSTSASAGAANARAIARPSTTAGASGGSVDPPPQEHSMSPPVTLRRDGAVAHLRFNRAARLNAVDVPTSNAFLECCRLIAASPDIRAVVLGGEGDAFGVGGDLNELKTDAASSALPLIEPIHEAVKLMAELDVPFIASLHGIVAGGSLSLAMACDLAIAAEGTKFNLAYVSIAATCDGSGSWSLPRIVGMRNAMAIALLGETFDAAEALRLGLVNKVVPLAALESSTNEMAQRLAAGPTLAIGRIKRLIRQSFDNDLASQLDHERDTFVANARSEDFTRAVASFLHKRRPQFHGR